MSTIFRYLVVFLSPSGKSYYLKLAQQHFLPSFTQQSYQMRRRIMQASNQLTNQLTSWLTNYMEQSVIQIEMLQVRRTSSITCFLFHGAAVPDGPGPPRSRGFLITFRHTTLGRTPLDEWSAQRRDLYLTTHNTQRDRHLYQRGDSNPQSQQANGRRPTPYTARPPGSAFSYTVVIHYLIKLVW